MSAVCKWTPSKWWTTSHYYFFNVCPLIPTVLKIWKSNLTVEFLFLTKGKQTPFHLLVSETIFHFVLCVCVCPSARSHLGPQPSEAALCPTPQQTAQSSSSQCWKTFRLQVHQHRPSDLLWCRHYSKRLRNVNDNQLKMSLNKYVRNPKVNPQVKKNNAFFCFCWKNLLFLDSPLIMESRRNSQSGCRPPHPETSVTLCSPTWSQGAPAWQSLPEERISHWFFDPGAGRTSSLHVQALCKTCGFTSLDWLFGWKDVSLFEVWCVDAASDPEVSLLDFYTQSQIWEKIISLQRLICCFLFPCRALPSQRPETILIFKFAHHAYDLFYNLKDEKNKNMITVIFCTDYYINTPIKHRIYVLWHFFRTYIYVMIARSRYFVLYEAHNALYNILLLLNICTGVEWQWCINGIFLSVIGNVFFPMIPSEYVHKINVYIVISSNDANVLP